MRLSAAVPVVALVLAAGCGSGSATNKVTLSNDYGAQLRASVAKTSSSSSKVSLTVATNAQGQNATFTGDGAFASGKEVVGQMTVKLGTVTVQERVLNGQLYMQLPGQPGWYDLPLKDLVGTSLESSTNPADGAKVLLATGKDVAKVGTDSVRGTSTTHYKGTIAVDPAKSTSPLAKLALQKLLDSGVTSLPFEAYLDAQGRLRKFSEVTDVTIKNVKAHVVTTLEFYDFGTAVDVVAPPTAEIKDGSALLSTIKGTLGGAS